MITTKIKPPYCDDPKCACNGQKMRLNGLCFVCDGHRTIEGHMDNFDTPSRGAEIVIVERYEE